MGAGTVDNTDLDLLVSRLTPTGFLRVAGVRTPEGQSASTPFVARYWPY